MEQHQYDELSAKVDKIYTALLGNDIAQDGGIVKRLQHIEKTCEELTKFKDKSKWTASLLIGGAGILGWLADKLLSLINNN